MDRAYFVVETILSLGVLLSATIFSPANIAEKTVGDAFSAAEFNQFTGSTRLFYLDDQGTALDTSDDMLGVGKNPTTKFDVAGSIEASGNVTATYFVGDGTLLTGIDAGHWIETGSDINYPAGNVGIGIASPNYSLDVNGDINFSGDIYQNDTLFSSGKFSDGTDSSDAVYLSGNVGIGDNDPNEALVVNGNIAWGSGLLKTDQGGSLELGDAGSNPYIDFKNDPTSDYDVRLSLIGNDSLEVSGGTLVAPEPITGTEVANKNYVDDRTAFAQITNTQVTDINKSSGAVIVFNTTALHNSDASLFTPINTGVQVLEAGVYEVYTNLYMTSSVSRTNVEIEFTVNGTKQGIRSAGAYLRNHSGHNESSGTLTQILTLSANDIVGVTTTEAANTGTVVLPTGQSNLIIKRLQ